MSRAALSSHLLLAPLPNSDSLSTNLAVTSSRKPSLTPSIIYLGIQPLSLLRCGLSNTGVGLAFIPLFPSVSTQCVCWITGLEMGDLCGPSSPPNPIDQPDPCIVSACWPLTKSVWSGRWVPTS